MIETFLQDLRIGFRVLAKDKGFCAIAVTVLALAIAQVGGAEIQQQLFEVSPRDEGRSDGGAPLRVKSFS